MFRPPTTTVPGEVAEGQAQIFDWGWNADYPDPENFLFLLYGPKAKASKGGENAANYDNPEFDRLFTRMNAMANGPDARSSSTTCRILRHDAPWMFGFIPKGFSLQHALGLATCNKAEPDGQ